MNAREFLRRMDEGDDFGQPKPSEEHIKSRNFSRNEPNEIPDELSDAIEKAPIHTPRIRRG